MRKFIALLVFLTILCIPFSSASEELPVEEFAPEEVVEVLEIEPAQEVIEEQEEEEIEESESPTPTPTPSPTPAPRTITVTKVLKGEIWQVRCDVMDGTDFKAGGGYWKADITNSANVTSKEGHRSNHCGDWENWVLFVDENGEATGLYQLKSGSTGGTLPCVVYRPKYNLSKNEIIYIDPTNVTDETLNKFKDNYKTPISYSEINLVEGQRLWWTTQNGGQVWHHTGTLRRTNPRFAIVINGVPYNLGVGESIQITEVEEGLTQVEEIATANYRLYNIEQDSDGNITITNEIDDPEQPTARPPKPPEKITPTPSPTPTPNPSPTPSPTPTPTSTPTATPTPSPTPTITPTVTPTQSAPTPTPTVSPTPISTITPTSTPPVPTPTITPALTVTPTETITATPTLTPTLPMPMITPTPIPTPIPTSAPLGKLKITKIVAIDGNETLDASAQGYTFKFRVTGPSDFDKTYKITVTNGHNSILIKNLEPGEYRVAESGKDELFTSHDGQWCKYVDVNYNHTAEVQFINDYNEPILIPEVPPTEEPEIEITIKELHYDPRTGKWYTLIPYAVPLGLGVPFVQVGDCFE